MYGTPMPSDVRRNDGSPIRLKRSDKLDNANTELPFGPSPIFPIDGILEPVDQCPGSDGKDSCISKMARQIIWTVSGRG